MWPLRSHPQATAAGIVYLFSHTYLKKKKSKSLLSFSLCKGKLVANHVSIFGVVVSVCNRYLEVQRKEPQHFRDGMVFPLPGPETR